MTVCFVSSRGLPTEHVVRLDALLQDLRPGGHPAEDEDGQGAPQEQGRPLWAQSGTKVLLDPAALPTVLTFGERDTARSKKAGLKHIVYPEEENAVHTEP